MIRDELLKLDNQLCFAIYACSREISRIYRPYLDKLDLTYTQYIVMLVLWEKDNITMKELGERLLLDSGTLTPLLKKMEATGLLYKRRSKEDERNILIGLTEKGENLKAAAYEIPQQVFCDAQMPVEEAVVLREQLKSLIKRLSIVK